MHAPVEAIFLPSGGCVADTFLADVTVSVCKEDVLVDVGDKDVVAEAVDDILNPDVDSDIINVTK